MNRNAIILVLAIGIYLSLIVVQLQRGISACDGKFVYPLDDPYIHLTIARNLATHGTWGMNPTEFASGSSSILYTLLLAGIVFFSGDSEYLPLIINILAGVAILMSLHAVLKRLGVDEVVAGLVLLASVFFIPLVSLTISGMEHTIQILINTWYFYFCLKYLSKQKYKWDVDFFWLCALSALVVMARFEGLFFLSIPAVYFFFSRQYAKSVVVGLSALLPVVIFGTISMLHGSYFLPNSLMIKADLPEHFGLLGLLEYSFAWLNKMVAARHLLGLFILLVTCFVLQNVISRKYKSMAYIACFSCIMLMMFHLEFARTGWFFRYESYLISLSLITLAIIYEEVKVTLLKYKIYFLVGVFVSLIPMARWSRWSFRDTPVAMQNIHDQQFQMAQFIKTYYPSGTVAANDIGAISFFNHIHLVDLFGLGNIEVLRLKEKGLFNKGTLDKITQRNGVKIAIVYDSLFAGLVPVHWTMVEKWVLQNNVICAFNDVSFYAVDSLNVGALRQNLEAFHHKLPERVTIVGSREINLR